MKNIYINNKKQEEVENKTVVNQKCTLIVNKQEN